MSIEVAKAVLELLMNPQSPVLGMGDPRSSAFVPPPPFGRQDGECAHSSRARSLLIPSELSNLLFQGSLDSILNIARRDLAQTANCKHDPRGDPDIVNT
ncbi:hypothetical protein TNCV_1077561 [Trichonephila clavipes]|uniref:Uncharacterized protein n=1 Tax=Trichonephila clavipes TaxID=2585209 RepID=A0A8X6RMV2_TRICX|nr:hypothetical protein TNCV_1077561 [Trichonephila clavipes]